jgi:hypothetical protein
MCEVFDLLHGVQPSEAARHRQEQVACGSMTTCQLHGLPSMLACKQHALVVVLVLQRMCRMYTVWHIVHL